MRKKGQMAGAAVGNFIVLIVGVVIAVLVMIFGSVLSGQAYSVTEADITAITNGTIRESAQNAVASGFEAMEDTGDYMPLIVLGVVIGLVLTIVLGLGNLGAGRGGSVL